MELFQCLEQKCERIRSDPFYRPYLKELIDCYESRKGTEIPALDYKTFQIYFETGSRKEYEKLYFERRKRLGQLLILCLLYDKKEYTDDLCEIIWAICGEISWALPAHLARERSDAYRTCIDLFAAETAHALAEIAFLMKDRLPEKIYELIKAQVTERIFDSYEGRPHFWETLISNWPGVCASGVGSAYILLAPERFEGVKARLLDNMEHFLKSYGEDGSNTEGISYWQYGFWCYLNFAELLYRHSDGKDDILHGEKQTKMADFLGKICLRKNIVVSFSDASRTYSFRAIGLYSFLKENYGMKIFFMAPKKLEITDNNNPPRLLRDFLWSVPEHYTESGDIPSGFEYLPEAEWYIVKKSAYSFAAKAGNNNEGHNHNDIGSFIFADDSGQLLADLGAMEYTADSFSDKRYTILSNSSLGHSVPILNGKAQKDGAKYRGKVLTVSKTEFSFELQDAYETDIKKATRRFEIHENGVTLTDSYQKSEELSVTERFISVIEPIAEGDSLHIGKAVLKCETAPEITKEVLKSHQCEPETVWLIDYTVKGNSFTVDIMLEEEK